MIGGYPFRAFLIITNRHFVLGSMMATWKIFLMILRYYLSGTCFFLKIIWISTTMSLALICEILTILDFPSTKKPKISFYVIQSASPFCSFFIDIGYLPPVSPVTSGGVKIL